MEIGIFTFAELGDGAAGGPTISPEQRLRDLMAEIELADQVGLDVFGVGEHHRPDFVTSAPAVALAACAARPAAAPEALARSVLRARMPAAGDHPDVEEAS